MENPYQARGTYVGRSYIERDADTKLWDAIKNNKSYPFFLSPRQSGKSSIMERARSILADEDLRIVIIDLSLFSKIRLIDFDQFLLNFITLIYKKLGIDGKLKKNLQDLKYEMTFLEDSIKLLLDTLSGRVIVCIDEVDTLLISKFKDDFLSQIRALFNYRSSDPTFKRIQFILAGAVSQDSLITNPNQSPFNVGERIILKDFSKEQVNRLVTVGNWLNARDIDRASDRIFYWTSGSVFLSQSILEKAYSLRFKTEESRDICELIDHIVEEMILSASHEIHFSNIAKQLGKQPSLLSAWKDWIDGIIPNCQIRDSLFLAGISSEKNPIRNAIYREVFSIGGTLCLVPGSLSAVKSLKLETNYIVDEQSFANLECVDVHDRETKGRNSFSEPIHIIPIQVPALTEYFVEPPVMQEIKSHLLNGSNPKGILAITAIQGLGGIGKTTLAKIIAHDKEVQTHFSDGILWVTLGPEPDKLSLLNGWIKALGDYQSNHTTVETASNHLITLLYEKCILLVVDDAWDSRDVKPFLVGGPNCQTIITTRKAYIADDLGSKNYSLGVLTVEQSLALFENVLKDSWNQNEKEDAIKVAKDLGYLPLALNLAAKRRLRDYSWAKLHEALKEENARLSVLSPRRLRAGVEEGLEASLNLSLKALKCYSEEAWIDFIWLGVLPESIKINERMASTLWGIEKEEAGQILEFLWEEGLLIPDSTIQLGDEKLKTYRIHDLFHDIARHYLTYSSAVKKSTELPGLGLELNEAHASLLNRYKLKTQKKGLWHTLEDDAYIHSHLTWHMEKAGQIEGIHALLHEENKYGKNGWYETLESLGQNVVFIEDLMRAWNLSEKQSEHQIEQGNKTSFIGLEIRYALIYTSINSLSANIPTELLVALLETKKWTTTKVFIYAQKEPDPFKRVTKLISIYQIINDESIKKEVLEKALEIASNIRSDYDRASALSALVPHLDGQRKEELMEKVLEIASNIQDDYDRVSTLSSIVPHLDGQRKEELMEKALELASNIRSDYDRASALSALVPHLDGQRKEELMEKAFEIVSNIQYDYDRVSALSALVPHLDGQRKEELMEKALEIALNIQSDSDRAKALCFILSLMRNSPVNKLYFWWRRVIQILKEGTRSNLLSNIITLIPVMNDLGGDETLFEISRAIIDVSNWFP